MDTISLFNIICHYLLPLYQYHQTQQEVKVEINRTLHILGPTRRYRKVSAQEHMPNQYGKIQSYEIDHFRQTKPYGGTYGYSLC